MQSISLFLFIVCIVLTLNAYISLQTKDLISSEEDNIISKQLASHFEVIHSSHPTGPRDVSRYFKSKISQVTHGRKLRHSGHNPEHKGSHHHHQGHLHDGANASDTGGNTTATTFAPTELSDRSNNVTQSISI